MFKYAFEPVNVISKVSNITTTEKLTPLNILDKPPTDVDSEHLALGQSVVVQNGGYRTESHDF